MDADIKVALVGNPNTGKSTLFNVLTGLNQKIGNFPGVTVDKKTGFCDLPDGRRAQIIDLPGTYSLYPKSRDESIVFSVLADKSNPLRPDLAVVIVDASNLKRNLLTETNNSIEIDTKYVVGSADYEIRELCNEVKPLAIVMGTHSQGALDRFFLGSKTLHAARHLKFPVLIVPPGTEFKPFRKIALASDLKDVYDVPVREIEMMVKYFNATLDIFYAGKNEKEINKHTINDMVLQERLEYLNPKFYFTEDADIMEGISALARKHNTDLLIVMPKSHGLFHKSESKDFILHFNVPVMAIHEDDMMKALE